MNNLIKYIAVIVIVLSCGAGKMLSAYIQGGLFNLLCFVYAFFFFLYQKGKIQKDSLLIFLILCSWIYIDQHLFQQGYDNLYVSYILSYASCFFIISTFIFEDFRKRLLKVVQWLSLFSIIAYILYSLNLISAHYNSTSELTTAFYFFNVEWGGRPRLSSIFWEPGQYQIILNFVLMLCSRDITDLIKRKKIITLTKRYFVIVLALVLTTSTTGYMVFAITCLYLTLSSMDKRHLGSGIIAGILLLVAVNALLQSDTVQNKFNSNNEAYNSYVVRLADNLGLLQMIEERPLTGYGIGTFEFEMRAHALGNETSSNGWLNAGAQMGIPFLILLLLVTWKGVHRLSQHYILSLILLAGVIMAQSNEALYYLAPLNLFIFKFKEVDALSHIKLKITNY